MEGNFWQGLWIGKEPAGDTHVRSREVVRPTGGIIRGKFPSRKNGRMVHYEGLLELDAIYHLETSPNIALYREQFAKIFYPDGDRIRRYTPDFEVILHTGEVVNIEVKPKAKLASSEIRAKFERISGYYARRGDRFVILHDEVIREKPRLANLKSIYHQSARIPPNAHAAEIAVQRFSREFPMPLAACIERLSSRQVCTFCLLMSGLLRCSLDQPITYETSIELSLETDHAWFFLAKEYGF